MINRHRPDTSFSARHRPVLRRLSVFAILVGLAAPAAAQQPETPPESAPAPAPNDSANGTSSAKEAPAGAANPPAPADKLPAPAELLGQARETLAGYRTLKARFIETAEFGPRRLRAEGTYLQGTDHRVRVDVEVAVGENKGRLLQISEGDVLWTVYHVNDKPKITRRDVNQILAATEGAEARATELAELGLGGLPALLASIDRSMEFEPTQTATVEGRTFYVLQGRWNKRFLDQFQQQMAQITNGAADPATLPLHVPDLIRVYLDSETFFPYRIRYLKQIPEAPGLEPTPILTLDFRDIVVNASLDPADFRYAPPADAEVADITSAYLQRLRGGASEPTGQPPRPTAVPGDVSTKPMPKSP